MECKRTFHDAPKAISSDPMPPVSAFANLQGVNPDAQSVQRTQDAYSFPIMHTGSCRWALVIIPHNRIDLFYIVGCPGFAALTPIAPDVNWLWALQQKRAICDPVGLLRRKTRLGKNLPESFSDGMSVKIPGVQRRQRMQLAIGVADSVFVITRTITTPTPVGGQTFTFFSVGLCQVNKQLADFNNALGVVPPHGIFQMLRQRQVIFLIEAGDHATLGRGGQKLPQLYPVRLISHPGPVIRVPSILIPCELLL